MRGDAATVTTSRIRIVVLILSALCVTAFLGAEEIAVGMSAAFSGPSRGLGIELYRGSIAYFEYVNANGGINGRRITVKAYDDRYDPIPAIENTIRLIEDDRVFLLFNYVGTPTVTRILPLLKRYQAEHFSLFFPFTGAQPQREPPYDAYVFNLRASYREETAGLVEKFLSIGRKRIAVFYQADAYGRSGWDGVRRALAIHDNRIVSEATYRRGTGFSESLSRQVEIIGEGNPEAIVSVGAYAACAAFIRDARNGGLDVPIANVSFGGSENMLSLLQEAGEQSGMDYSVDLINSQVVPSYENTALSAVREYRELMQSQPPAPPREFAERGYTPLARSFVSFEGFLNAKLLVEMLRAVVGDPDSSLGRDRIRNVVEGMTDIDIGIDTPISFGEQRHQGLKKVYFTTVEKDRFVPIDDWGRWRK